MSWLFKEVSHAQLYLKYRPNYPSSVFSTILEHLKVSSVSTGQPLRLKLALDVGCGSGQSTLPLCEHFESVIGLDYSEAQIEKAKEASKGYSNLSYRVAEAHELGFQTDGSVDTITVAQALHWVNGSKFYPECLRVLRKGGVLAAYGYGTPRIEGSRPAQELLSNFYWQTLKGYWDPGRKHIDDLMARVFEEMKQHITDCRRDDTMTLHKNYTVDDFVGYLSSWSGYQKYRQLNPTSPDPLQDIHKRLSRIYVNTSIDSAAMHVVSPIFMLLGTNK